MHIKEMHFKLLQYCCNQLSLSCFTIMISIGRRLLYFRGYVMNMKVLPFANLYFPIRMFLFRSSRSLICIFVFSFDFPVYWIAVRRNSSMKLSSLTTLAMMVSNICDLWKNICFYWLKHLSNIIKILNYTFLYLVGAVFCKRSALNGAIHSYM